MKEIIDKIIEILVDVKEIPISADCYDENSKIIEDIGLDSLEMINFILRVEDEYNIEINFDEFDFTNMKDIKTFAAFIEKCLIREDKVGA